MQYRCAGDVTEVCLPVGECGRSSCADEPCMNGGTCVADDTDFTCACTHEYSGGLLCKVLFLYYYYQHAVPFFLPRNAS